MKEKVIPAAEFKAKCLRILDELEPQGILITKRGKAIARVLPATTVDNKSLIGSMKGKIQIKGDIFSTGVSWNAESGYPRRGRGVRRRSK